MRMWVASVAWCAETSAMPEASGSAICRIRARALERIDQTCVEVNFGSTWTACPD